MDLNHLRLDYNVGALNEADLDPDPFRQFTSWLKAALGANLVEPHGMILSTVGTNGRPSSRVVLLRSFDERGFVFFTNYHSRKGQDLVANSSAALNFWWPELHRQVRIEGAVEKVEPELSDSYFTSRPYESQIGSAASPQSEVIANRAVLDAGIAELRAQYPESLPRPAHWGGFRLKPDYFEFWQGRPNRLHDRLSYTWQDGSWKIRRLAP